MLSRNIVRWAESTDCARLFTKPALLHANNGREQYNLLTRAGKLNAACVSAVPSGQEKEIVPKGRSEQSPRFQSRGLYPDYSFHLALNMKKLYSPTKQVDLTMLKSILESADITFFIENDSFGSLHIGPSIELFNQQTIFVEDEYEEEAKELLKEYLASTYPDNEPAEKTSVLDKIRMLTEALLSGWFIPGKKWKSGKK
ncbi:MAG: DUF2007 domain-containing protein [Candidatus Electrothrix sp. EH2]|nr:DUF2007 domain-containing protein [Candidatus Electrothrix sp. EH2]